MLIIIRILETPMGLYWVISLQPSTRSKYPSLPPAVFPLARCPMIIPITVTEKPKSPSHPTTLIGSKAYISRMYLRGQIEKR